MSLPSDFEVRLQEIFARSPEARAVLDDVDWFVRKYMAQFGVPVPLAILARRFGKRCSHRVGLPLLAVMDYDRRFVLSLNKRGAQFVAVRSMIPASELFLTALRTYGSMFSREQLRTLLRKDGMELDVFEGIVKDLTAAGVIRTSEVGGVEHIELTSFEAEE